LKNKTILLDFAKSKSYLRMCKMVWHYVMSVP